MWLWCLKVSSRPRLWVMFSTTRSLNARVAATCTCGYRHQSRHQSSFSMPWQPCTGLGCRMLMNMKTSLDCSILTKLTAAQTPSIRYADQLKN